MHRTSCLRAHGSLETQDSCSDSPFKDKTHQMYVGAEVGLGGRSVQKSMYFIVFADLGQTSVFCNIRHFWYDNIFSPILQALSFLLTFSANAMHKPCHNFSEVLCHLYVVFQFQHIRFCYSFFPSHSLYYRKAFSRIFEDIRIVLSPKKNNPALI